MPRKPRVALLAPMPAFNPSDLEPDLRKSFIQKDEQVTTAMRQVGKAMLMVGKYIFEMQEILKAKRMFVAWIQTRLPAKSAYRLLGAWKRLHEINPMMAEIALAMDIPCWGVTDRSPYGKYTPIMDQLIPKLKNEKDPSKIAEILLGGRELLKTMRKPTRTGQWLDSLGDAMARAFLRDPKAEDFKDWLKRVSAVAEARIKEIELKKLPE